MPSSTILLRPNPSTSLLNAFYNRHSNTTCNGPYHVLGLAKFRQIKVCRFHFGISLMIFFCNSLLRLISGCLDRKVPYFFGDGIHKFYSSPFKLGTSCPPEKEERYVRIISLFSAIRICFSLSKEKFHFSQSGFFLIYCSLYE